MAVVERAKPNGCIAYGGSARGKGRRGEEQRTAGFAFDSKVDLGAVHSPVELEARALAQCNVEIVAGKRG